MVGGSGQWEEASGDSPAVDSSSGVAVEVHSPPAYFACSSARRGVVSGISKQIRVGVSCCASSRAFATLFVCSRRQEQLPAATVPHDADSAVRRGSKVAGAC